MKIGYPNRQAERAILTQHRAGEPIEDLKPVLDPADIVALQSQTRAVRVDDAIADYILDLVDRTRSHTDVLSAPVPAPPSRFTVPRKALALTFGRDYVIPDDVKRLAESVLAHRLVTRGWTQGGHPDASPVVREILSRIEPPS